MGCRSCTSITNIDTFAYNEFGELVSAHVGSMDAVYTYRPDGLRGTKTVNGTLTRHIWDGDEVSAELNADSSVKRTFTHGYAPATCYEGNDHYAFIRDRHGDVIKTVECFTESVIEEYTYDAYGNQRDLDSPHYTSDTNPYRYSGEYYDYETGFIYLRARYYDTSTGTFISEDPARDGINWYAYCAGNPVMFVDPTGMVIFVHGSDEDRQSLRNELQKLTNKELEILTYEENGIIMGYYISETGNSANIGKDLVKGTQLVSDLMDPSVSVHINYYADEDFLREASSGGGEMGRFDKSKGTSIGEGTSSGILISRKEYEHWTIDENGNSSKEKTPIHIALGHELIHAWRAAKGYYIPPDTQLGEYQYIDEKGNTQKSGKVPVEELATTGLNFVQERDGYTHAYYDYWSAGYMTENALRDEQGLNRRTRHW